MSRRLRLRRSLSWIDRELLAIAQNIQVRGRQTGTDATGPHWTLGLVTVHEGSLAYLRGPGEVAPPGRRFAVYLPPFSLVQVRLHRCRVSTTGFVSPCPLPGSLPDRPIAFRPASPLRPRSLAEVVEAVRGARQAVDISRELRPPPLARRIKALLEAEFRRPLTLRTLAARARLSPAVLSRAFKRGYGLTPSEYRHRLRVMEGMLRLAEGGEVLDVAADVGFQDPSRLYHHFRTLVCAPPGWHRREKSRNAKTAGRRP